MGSTNTIVPEVLTEENYESWKIWMKSYLLGEELWDIVVGTEPKPDEVKRKSFRIWRKKNGKALHAIQVSCGPEALSCVSEIDTANDAWDHLASIHQPQPVSFENSPEASEPSPACLQGQSSTDEGNWRSLLYKAVVNGDWESTKKVVDTHPEALSARLSMGETILHIAVLHDQVQVVQELVKLMSIEELEAGMPNRRGGTALHLVVFGGVVKIAEALVNKNPNLLGIRDQWGRLPVNYASISGHKDMFCYLYSVTPDEELTSQQGATVFTNVILDQDYEFALYMHRRFPQLTTIMNIRGATVLTNLATRPYAFPSGVQLWIWKRWIYNFPALQQMHDLKLNHIQGLELIKSMSNQVSTFDSSQIVASRVIDAVMLACQYGTVELFVEMLKANPALICVTSETAISIFYVAIAYRQEKICNLICGLRGHKGYFGAIMDQDGNTLLHAAGKLAPANRLINISGAAMQMQWELQWFKEVEMMLPHALKENKNKSGKNARALFTEEHKDLLKEGEKWMKDTATSCMVVATLIATVMFAATFTVPGGNNDQTGIPIFLGQDSFMLFIVADALSLFSSTTSVLMFLSILTSRYAEEDFLKALPKRLIIGLATLFFSIATMMVAFSAAIFIVLGNRYKWTAIPISLLASVPVTLFALLQFPLFVDMISSTYGPGIFRKQTEPWFRSMPEPPKECYSEYIHDTITV